MEPLIDEFFALQDTGITLFSWSRTGSIEGVELLSGFLTALNIFAKSEKGETMKELTLESTTFIFEKKNQVIYVITTKMTKGKDLIRVFLETVIDEFERRYSSRLEKFDGNVSGFEQFTQVIENIRYWYGIGNIDVKGAEVATNDVLQSISVITKSSGDILYTEAKQFVDKEELGYLIPLLSRGATMASSDVENFNPTWILIITSKERVMFIQILKHVFFVEEYKVKFDYPNEFNSKQKKIKELFTKSFFLPEIKHFELLTNQGKIVEDISRDPSYNEHVGLDATMIVNGAKNLVTRYFKTELRGVCFGDDARGLLIIPFKSFFILAVGPQEEFRRFAKILGAINKITS